VEEAGGQYLAAAASLSRTLLGPVAGQLGKKRLLIVADGSLHYIPFGALPDPNSLKESEGNWRPLIVEHEVVNLPSASTIAAGGASRDVARQAVGSALLLGGVHAPRRVAMKEICSQTHLTLAQ
jgi:CHAT domain